MTFNGELLGTFIVPTGIGASIGGYAGDASCYAREFTSVGKLIVNPNVVNAGCFSGINEKMFYVEGFAIDDFFKGNICLTPTREKNKIGVIFDKSIPQDVLNIHINTINAVKTVYGIDVSEYEITEAPVGVNFYVDKSGVSTGGIENEKTLRKAGQKLLDKGCEALAVVCLFDEGSEDEEYNYSSGAGVDPVGGVEAIISHYLTRELHVPCAHSPAFENYEISNKIVNPKAAAEYITPTFLPCVLKGLSMAPKIGLNGEISVKNTDYLVVPANAIGSVPVFEAVKNRIPVFAIKENVTVLNVTNESIRQTCGIYISDTYEDCLELIKNEFKI